MASAEREPITGVWGEGSIASSGLQGRAPGQGLCPLKPESFGLSTSNGSSKLPYCVKICKKQKQTMSTQTIFASRMVRQITALPYHLRRFKIVYFTLHYITTIALPPVPVAVAVTISSWNYRTELLRCPSVDVDVCARSNKSYLYVF